jgi:rod shape-determining protein MreC
VNAFSKEITAPILKLESNFLEWLHLREENVRLASQNKELLRIVFNHTMDTSAIATVYLSDSSLFVYHTAKVIESTLNKQNNYIILDKGYNDGIKVDMGVISTKGVIGIIKEVSPNFSVALSLLHSQFSIFVKIENSDASGILTWNGADIRYAQINNLAHIENVHVLDTVRTQHSLLFPPDYPIGIISSIGTETARGYYVLTVKLLPSFDKLGNVFIIEQKYSDELNNLMERVTRDE